MQSPGPRLWFLPEPGLEEQQGHSGLAPQLRSHVWLLGSKGPAVPEGGSWEHCPLESNQLRPEAGEKRAPKDFCSRS